MKLALRMHIHCCQQKFYSLEVHEIDIHLICLIFCGKRLRSNLIDSELICFRQSYRDPWDEVLDIS
jgi:hypothetical protein